MKVTPITKNQKPGFPTKPEVMGDPALLKTVPERWKDNIKVMAALAGAVAILSSANAANSENKNQAAKYLVAPVFEGEYGEGRGAFGCVAVNPPVVLSEDEARQIIIEELKKFGIDAAKTTKTINNIQITYKNFDGTHDYKIKKVLLDGNDPLKNVSFEYISVNDSREIIPGMFFNTKEAASLISVEVKKKELPGTFVAFYDPMVPETLSKIPYDYKSTREERTAQYNLVKEQAQEYSKQDLRKQVKDFIKWLKTEGVI